MFARCPGSCPDQGQASPRSRDGFWGQKQMCYITVRSWSWGASRQAGSRKQYLARISAYFRVSPSCLESEWGKIIWIKKKAWHFFSFPSNESCSFPHLKTAFCSIFSQRHFLPWLPFHRLSEPTTPSSLFTPFNLLTFICFSPHGTDHFKQPFLIFSYYHSPVFRTQSNPKLFAMILTIQFHPPPLFLFPPLLRDL